MPAYPLPQAASRPVPDPGAKALCLVIQGAPVLSAGLLEHALRRIKETGDGPDSIALTLLSRLDVPLAAITTALEDPTTRHARVLASWLARPEQDNATRLRLWAQVGTDDLAACIIVNRQQNYDLTAAVIRDSANHEILWRAAWARFLPPSQQAAAFMRLWAEAPETDPKVSGLRGGPFHSSSEAVTRAHLVSKAAKNLPCANEVALLTDDERLLLVAAEHVTDLAAADHIMRSALVAAAMSPATFNVPDGPWVTKTALYRSLRLSRYASPEARRELAQCWASLLERLEGPVPADIAILLRHTIATLSAAEVLDSPFDLRMHWMMDDYPMEVAAALVDRMVDHPDRWATFEKLVGSFSGTTAELADTVDSVCSKPAN